MLNLGVILLKELTSVCVIVKSKVRCDSNFKDGIHECNLNNLCILLSVCLEKLCVLLRFIFIKNVVSLVLCHFKSKVRGSNYNCRLCFKKNCYLHYDCCCLCMGRLSLYGETCCVLSF